MFKILGIIFIIFGAIDLVGALFLDFDLWGKIGWTTMPDLLWQYSAYIELIIGFVLFNMSTKSE